VEADVRWELGDGSQQCDEDIAPSDTSHGDKERTSVGVQVIKVLMEVWSNSSWISVSGVVQGKNDA
jgi:hypothetical protein